MPTNYTQLKKKLSVFGALLFFATPVFSQVLSYTFNYTGAVQTITVPNCVTLMNVDVRGAQGGPNGAATGTGALGGGVTGQMTVNPGDVLNIYVGGINGYNGGGIAGDCSGCAQAAGGVGGGASDIRLNGTALANRVVVAGGGGGCGGDRIPTCGRGAGGGGGGGYYGGGGGSGWAGSTAGGTVASGGSQTAGGFGGTSTYALVNNGGNGALGVGGAGGGEVGSGQGTPQHPGYAAGEGGGLTGNNGFGTFVASYWPGCGGAGGSSYLGSLTSAVTTPSVQSGNGRVIISYNFGVPSLTISGTNGFICSGSTVTLTASGSPSYTWSNGSTGSSMIVTPTANATYSVIGTSTAVCPPYGIIQTTIVPAPMVTASTSALGATVCPGTNVTLTGSGTDTYLWTGGISNGVAFPTGTATTVYTVTGTSSITGCSSSATVNVPVYPTPATISSNTSICNGQSVNLSASGGIQYNWSNGQVFPSFAVSPSVTTVYNVTVTSSDFCLTNKSVTVTVNPLPPVTAVCSRTSICRGESTTINASGASTYSWSNTSSGASVTVSPQSTTTYTVYGTGSGCTGMALTTVKVTVCVGIDELNAGSSFVSVYPNPSNGNLTIKSKSSMDLVLSNELGQVIKTVQLSEKNNFSVNLNELPAGIYFLKGKDDNQAVNQKIIIQ